MGGSGSQLKIEKNWRKFEILEKFTCIRYWSNNSVNFKNRSKSENFWHFGDFYSLLKPPMKLFLFFWYTVDPWEHVGAFFKKIQVKKMLIKIIVSPLPITYYFQSNSFHHWYLFSEERFPGHRYPKYRFYKLLLLVILFLKHRLLGVQNFNGP